MRPVYQPLAALALAVRLAGCGAPAEPSAPQPAERAWPLPVFLASRDYDPAGVDGAGRLLATERGSDGARAVRLAPGAPPAPLVATPESVRVVAAFRVGERALVELAGAASDQSPRLAVVEHGGLRPLGERGAPPERFLGATPDAATLWTARTTATGSDEVLETTLPAFARRTVYLGPPGFRAQAIASDGIRLVVARRVAPAAVEMLLVDRRLGETRLILPSGPDGDFRALLFDDAGERLLLSTDDASELPRFEWLTLQSGARVRALASDCAAVDAWATAGRIVADVSCAGRREIRPLEGEAPWQGRLPVGLRAHRAFGAGDAGWWLALDGARAARDLARLPPERALEPATWGLAPRLEPAVLPVPELRHVTSAGIELPVELWTPAAAPFASLVWLEADDRPPDWDRFEPFFAFLAARGVAVVRLRPRGSEGFGRPVRDGAGDDRAASALADARAAARLLAEATGAHGLPAVLVGAGGEPAIAALAAASRSPAPFARIAVLDPPAPPAAEPAAPPPAPPDPPAVPLLLVLDERDAGAANLAALATDWAASGAEVTLRARPRPLFARGAGSAALEALWRHLAALRPR